MLQNCPTVFGLGGALADLVERVHPPLVQDLLGGLEGRVVEAEDPVGAAVQGVKDQEKKVSSRRLRAG